MANILITGASSFIGKKMCSYFLERGDRVFGVVRKNCPTLPSAVTQIYAEMSDYEKLDTLLPSDIDVGVLLAWDGTRGAARNDEALQHHNIRCNLACLNALRQRHCRVVVFAGSQAEYGPQYGNSETLETDSPKPNTPYGMAKLEFGKLAADFCREYGIRYLEPRIFSIYGEGDFSGTLTMSLLKKMIHNEDCELTACVQLWDYLYIDDAVWMIGKLIENKNAVGIYNIASGKVSPLKDFVMKMYEITQSRSSLLFGAIPYPSTGIVNINPSIRKLQDTIGAYELVPFEEGIRRTLASI